MKLIVLILASDTGVYLECQKLWKIYMNTHPNIKSYFIKYKSELLEDVVLENDNIFIKGEESFIPGCLDKTVKAIEFCLKTQEFDFIFRTNMSSVIDLIKFNHLLENYNRHYSGFIGIHSQNIKFASGAGMLLSKQFCTILTSCKDKLNYSVQDDVSIGDFCHNIRNIQIAPLTRFETFNYENNLNEISNELIKDYYHFRCKSEKDNNKTLLMMKKIIDLIYFMPTF
jgi:hypothetical protein